MNKSLDYETAKDKTINKYYTYNYKFVYKYS